MKTMLNLKDLFGNTVVPSYFLHGFIFGNSILNNYDG